LIRFQVSLAAAALAVGLLLAAAPANAQSARTWVSGVGSDANPCSRTAPCQTFATAISKTNPGGEIDCLDSGGFGRVDIFHSISIICDGVGSGGIAMGAQGDAIDIEAGPSDVIVLSGLDLEGAGIGINGVDFQYGQTLYVRNCVFRNFTQGGITFGGPSNAPPITMVLHVDNTTIENTISNTFNTLPTPSGIMVSPGANAVSITINRSQIASNTYGIIVGGANTTGTVRGVVRDSVVSDNTQNGVTASATGGAISLVVDNVAVTDNGNNGLVASGANIGMLVRNSTVSGNGGGLHEANAGVIDSYGNNSVNGNSGNDGAFTSTIAQK
jgi:hypothetical protein